MANPAIYGQSFKVQQGKVAVPAGLDATACVIGMCSNTAYQPGGANAGMTGLWYSGSSLQAAVGYGDGVDTCAQMIQQPGSQGGAMIPQSFCGLPPTTPGSVVSGSLVTGANNAGSATWSASGAAYGKFQPYIYVSQGGTLGTAGIQIQWALDAARSGLSDGTSLSTNNTATAGSLTSSPASFPVSIASGKTFIGKVDEQGSATTGTVSAVAATVTGSGATYAAVTANHTLVLIMGGISVTVTFTGSESTQAGFLATINGYLSAAAAGAASNSGGQTKLSTAWVGSGAMGSVVSGDADVLASTGLSVGAFSAGTGTFPDSRAVTAAQFAAWLTSTFTGGTAGSTGTANANNSVTWASNTAGASPKGVQFTGGTGVALIAGFDTSEHNGTATGYAFTIPGSNVTFAWTAGTLVAGDYGYCWTYAPQPAAADIDTAFASIVASGLIVTLLVFEFDITEAMIPHITTGLNNMALAGKPCAALCRVRMQNFATNESATTWFNAVQAIGASIYAAIPGGDYRITIRAGYGYVADALSGRIYLRPTLQQLAADTVASGVQIAVGSPNANFAGEAAVSLVSAGLSVADPAAGTLVGHDDNSATNQAGPTGLSNVTVGNHFACEQRLPNPLNPQAVYDTVGPYTFYGPTDELQTLPAVRVANRVARFAANANFPQLGGNVPYTPANPNIVGSQPTLTAIGLTKVQSVVFQALSAAMQGQIQNANDANLQTGLVQVNPIVTVGAGNAITISINYAIQINDILAFIAGTLVVLQ